MYGKTQSKIGDSKKKHVGGFSPTYLSKICASVKLDHETPGIGVKINKYLKFHHLVSHQPGWLIGILIKVYEIIPI